MKRPLTLTMLALIVASLDVACERPQPPDETVFDDQTDALQKAREVEDSLMDRAEEMKRKLEDEQEDNPNR